MKGTETFLDAAQAVKGLEFLTAVIRKRVWTGFILPLLVEEHEGGRK